MTGRRPLTLVLALTVLAAALPAAAGAAPAASADSEMPRATDGTTPEATDRAIPEATDGTTPEATDRAIPEATDGDDGAAVCDGVSGSGNVVVATLASTGERITQAERLYANVTLELRLCSSEGLVTPYGDAWALEPGSGYAVLAESDRGPRVRLEPGYGSIDFPSKIEKRQDTSGLTVTEPAANAVDPRIGVDGRLYVPSATTVDDYRSLESAFLGASNRTASTLGTLNETTAALDGSDGSFNASTANRTLERLDASVDELNATAGEFRALLFGVATESQTPGVAVDALAAVDRTESTQRRQATAAVAAYDAALDARERSLTSTIRNNVLLAAVVGLVLGLVAGGALPYLAANRTIGRKRIDSTAAYNRYALLVPVGGGILLVVGTVAVVAATAGLSLFGVIL